MAKNRHEDRCVFVSPMYYGDRPVMTRGTPSDEGSWIFYCNKSSLPPKRGKIRDICENCPEYIASSPFKKMIKEIADQIRRDRSL